MKILELFSGTECISSAYPAELCEHIVDICERYFDMEPLPWTIGKTITQTTLFDEYGN